MAGVQIPTLKRIEQTGPASADMLRVDIPDGTKGFDKNMAAVSRLGDVAIDYTQQLEENAADTEATKRVNEYERTYRMGIYGSDDGEQVGLKFQEGDPTQNFKVFDEKMIEKFDELTSDSNLSGRARELTIKRLTDKQNQLELQKLSEYGYAQAKYEDGIVKANIDLEKTSLSDAVSLIATDKEIGMQKFDESIGRIRAARLRGGMKTGGVVPDENGKSIYIGDDGKPMRVSVGPGTEVELKKDLSDGISGAIEDALITGNVGLASELRDKYGQYLDSSVKKRLQSDFTKASVDDAGYRIAAMGMNSADSQKLLEGIKDPVLRDRIKDKALDITNDRESKMEQRRTRLSKTSYDTVMNAVQKGIESGQITTKTDLEELGLYKNLERHITDPRQRQALLDAVVQPKNSNMSSLKRVQDLMSGGTDKDGRTLREMPIEDVYEAASGLNKPDRTRFLKRYGAVTSPETGDAEARKYKRANDELKNQLLALNVLKEDDFNRVSGKEFDRLIEYRTQLENIVDDLGPNPSQKDVNQVTRDFALSLKKGEVYKPSAAPTKFNAGGTFGGIKTKKVEIPIAERMKYMKQFYQENGRAADRNTDELDKYILKQQSDK